RSEPKTFASLGPTLLARKGGAKPAMRPQLAPLTGMGAQTAQAIAQEPEDLDDLGWNDMGADEEIVRDSHVQEAQVYSLTPAPTNADAEAESRVVDAAAHADMADSVTKPLLLLQRPDKLPTTKRKERAPDHR